MRHILRYSTLLLLLSFENYAQCFSKIDAGLDFSVGIKDDGTLWTWGANYEGQLGNGVHGFGSAFEFNVPTQIGIDTDWEFVSAGSNHSLAIKSNGTLWAWGYNYGKNLGFGTGYPEYVTVPSQIGTANNWLAISAGENNSLAIKNDGSLWAWGQNVWGEVGNGTSNIRVSAPIQIGSDLDWQFVYACHEHSLAIKNDGTLWAWGLNSSSQFGNGTTTDSNVPIQIGSDTDWVIVAGAAGYGFGIKSNGTLWGWGDSNYLGQLGNGTTVGSILPTQIGTDTNWKNIYTGPDLLSATVLATKIDGTLWGWGNNGNGQLGVGSSPPILIPTQITSNEWQSVSEGMAHTLGIKVDGSLLAWGSDGYGQLGNGNITGNINTPNLIVNCSLGISDIETVQISIHPNPTSTDLFILSDSEMFKIELFDIDGRLILAKDESSKSIYLDMSIFQTGIYTLKILLSNQTVVKKIVRK